MCVCMSNGRMSLSSPIVIHMFVDTNGDQLAADIIQQGDDVFKVEFTPIIVG